MSNQEIATENLNNINGKIQIIRVNLNLIGAIDGSLNYNYFINTENTQKSYASAPFTQLYIPIGLTFNEFSSELIKPYNKKQNQEIFLDINKLLNYLGKFNKKTTYNRLFESKNPDDKDLSHLKKLEELKKLEKNLEELTDQKKFLENQIGIYQKQLSKSKLPALSQNRIDTFQKNINDNLKEIKQKDQEISDLTTKINKNKNIFTSKQFLDLSNNEILDYVKQKNALKTIEKAGLLKKLKEKKNKIGDSRLESNILNILKNIFFSNKSILYLKGNPFIIEKSEISNDKIISISDVKKNKEEQSKNPLDYVFSFYQLEEKYIEDQVKKYKEYHNNPSQQDLDHFKLRIETDIRKNPSRLSNYAEDLIRDDLNKKFKDKGFQFEYSQYRGISVKNLTKPQIAYYKKIKGLNSYRKVQFTIKIKDGETNLFKKIQKKCLSKRSQIDKTLFEEIQKSKTLYNSNQENFVKFVNKNLGHSKIPIPTYANLILKDPFPTKTSSSTKKGGRVIKAKKKRTKKLKHKKKKGNIKL